MENKKRGKQVLALCLCLVLAMGVTACSPEQERQSQTKEPQRDEENNPESQVKGVDNSQDSTSLFENANLEGSVVEFSDTEISISKATTETLDDGGEVMVEAAPGMENEEELVHVTYAENAVIQLLLMDSASQTQVSLSNSDKSSIKKQSSVLVFGSCQDTYHCTADKVVIIRWQ